ncbi:MAG: ATP-binding cassette domain-containing protein [Geminicoccaceae bacterium]|nr:ATP-binding cassette domain-containing protein [Geminicoccaceae bacterium]
MAARAHEIETALPRGTAAPPPALRCEGLWKVFGADPATLFRNGGRPDADALKAGGYIAAVNDVSIEVAAGEILIVMGLSGSGKSTLIRCLARLIDSTAGRVEVEGRNLLTMNEKDLIELRRHKMGMVFQNFALLPHKTVLDNVAFPLQMRGMGGRERLKRAREMVTLVGLEGREAYFPRELSGGQQQRVGIARSLAVEPDIWFLDEPFSALDPLIRREMQDEFLRLQRMLHKTIVFITHDFEEALRLADRIVIMRNGRAEQVGRAEELVLNPATEYVARFTREVPRARIVTVRSVMDAPDGAASGRPVPASARIEAVARRMIEGEETVPVVDEGGALVGSVRRGRVLDVLFGAA